jgi:hypothetical protein
MRLLTTSVLVVLALTACGRQEDTARDPDVVDAVSALDACDDVWVEGETLSKGYEGCRGPDDETIVDGIITCEDGDRFVTYEEDKEGRAFYARGGEAIVAIPAGSSPEEDPTYAAAYEDCAGKSPTAP